MRMGGKSLDVFRARTRSDIPVREKREIEKYMTAKKHEKVEKDGMLEKNIVWNLGVTKCQLPRARASSALNWRRRQAPPALRTIRTRLPKELAGESKLSSDN